MSTAVGKKLASRRICKYCYIDLVDDDDEITHFFGCSHTHSTITVQRSREENPSSVTVTVRRAKDGNLYCPIEGCNYRVYEDKTFRSHIGGCGPNNSHGALRIVLKAEVKGRTKRAAHLEYTPVADTKAPAAPRVPFTISTPASVTLVDTSLEVPMSLTIEGRPRLSSVSPRVEPPAPVPPPPQVTNKRKASNDDLRASLLAEYRKKVHAEMLRTLVDPDPDYQESSKRREMCKIWFEEGMEELRKTEKDV
ncbi:hypothetical protein BJ508DRAFT_313791 [Ascobolus immersus RN42]|uniref:Uncharacterized protein n=1 Tax=Ascobolus immersus RN42 TaxID=1160509 RepID=A0A3N4HNT7_ASCIM|nr:hypothetical protein BJ508DRAFT_313791 [Ascobolus immersus RN42]